MLKYMYKDIFFYKTKLLPIIIPKLLVLND